MKDTTPPFAAPPLPSSPLAPARPRPWPGLLVALAAAMSLACGSDPAPSDAATQDAAAAADTTAGVDGGADGKSTDAGTADAGTADAGTADAGTADAGKDPNREAFKPASAMEHALGGGWIGAGQPSEARLLEVVKLGATVLSLRTQGEDPFDEPALVKGAGGTFIRYPVVSSDYQSEAFREALYDLYDAQMKTGKLVYLHCASSNRVGASWALYQAERKGVAPAEALELGKAAGLSSLLGMVKQILGI